MWTHIYTEIKEEDIYLVRVRLGTEVLRIPSSTRLGFELMTSKNHDSRPTLHVTETPALTTQPSVIFTERVHV